MKPLIMGFCAAYLTRPASTQEPADPSPAFIQESFGIMVNYLYDIETIESNHEAFVNDGTVTRSADVDALLAAEPISAPNSESCGITTA